MAAINRPTRFFVIIPRDIRELLVPKRSEAFGLYAQLADAVTCNVTHGAKKFGLVFGGASKSQKDWAKLFRMSERSFQRALAVLKIEQLVVVHRGQHASRMAIADSVKQVKRHASIQNFPWLLGYSGPPETAELDSQSAPPEMAALSANTAALSANTAELDESKTAQPVGNAMTCGERDGREERTEERTEDIPSKWPTNSAAVAAENQPSASPKSKFTNYPTDFTPNDDNRALASKLGLDITDDMLAAFADHHKAKGSRMADWNCSLNGWLRNAHNFSRKRPSPPATIGSLTDNYQAQIKAYTT